MNASNFWADESLDALLLPAEPAADWTRLFRDFIDIDFFDMALYCPDAFDMYAEPPLASDYVAMIYS